MTMTGIGVRPAANTRKLALWLGVLALFGQIMIPTYTMAIGARTPAGAIPICFGGGTVWVVLDKDGRPVGKQPPPAAKPCHFCFGPGAAPALPHASPISISFTRSVAPAAAPASLIVASLPISPLPIRAPPATA